MEPSLYSYSLIFALPLMLFFGVYLLFPQIRNYAPNMIQKRK